MTKKTESDELAEIARLMLNETTDIDHALCIEFYRWHKKKRMEWLKGLFPMRRVENEFCVDERMIVEDSISVRSWNDCIDKIESNARGNNDINTMA